MVRLIFLFTFSLLLFTHSQCEEYTQQCISNIGLENGDSYMNDEQQLTIISDSSPPTPIHYDDTEGEYEEDEIIIEGELPEEYQEENIGEKNFYDEDVDQFEEDDEDGEEELDRQRESYWYENNERDFAYNDRFEEDYGEKINEFGEEYSEADFSFGIKDEFNEGEYDEYEEDDDPTSMHIAGGSRLADMTSLSPPNITDFDDDY